MVMRDMAFPRSRFYAPNQLPAIFLDASLQVRASHGEGKGGHFSVACC